MKLGSTPTRSGPASSRQARTVLALVLGVAGITALVLMSGPGPAPSHAYRLSIPPGDPIQLGTLLVTSGTNASLGIDSHRGTVLAVRMRGPLLGHSVRLVHEDDGCSREQAAAAARRLVRQSILAVIGPSCSSAVDPARSILGRGRILVVSPSTTPPDLTDPATTYFARTAHNDRLQGKGAALLARREFGATTAAIVTEEGPYSKALGEAFEKTFVRGGNVVIRAHISDPVLAEKVARDMAPHRPDVVFAPIFAATGGAFTRAARAILPDSHFVFADGALSPEFIDIAGPENMEDLTFVVPDLDSSTRLYRQVFLPAFEKAFEEEPQSVFHAHAFDATNMILDALQDVSERQADGTLIIDRRALRDAFFSLRGYEGISGALSCGPSGDCRPQIDVELHDLRCEYCDPPRVTVLLD